MKRILIATLACAAMSVWAQNESNAEWEMVSKSSSSELKYFFKKDSETTSKKNGNLTTTALFSRANKGSQDMVAISIRHRDCVAKYGSFNVSKLSDKSFTYDSEFAFGRPQETVADGVASHLCKIAWQTQILELARKKKADIDYFGRVEMQKIFDSFLAEVRDSPSRGNKDIDDILQEVHQMVMAYIAKQ